MKKNFLLLIIIVFVVFKNANAQPFVDVVNFSYQRFATTYPLSSLPFYSIQGSNTTDNYSLNLFLPKEFKNGNTLLIRCNSEMINSTISYNLILPAKTKTLKSVSLPLGFQFVSKNKKWKTVAIVIPKIASDFKDPINDMDYQLGGIFLQHFQLKDNVKIKVGLYYNREAFGDFYVPLVGLDWKISKRFSLYGILPTNYKFEFNILKNKLYTGLCFKSFTRSFRLSKADNYDYVRYDEVDLKLFVDYFVYKKVLLFGEVGYTLGKSPIQYMNNTKEKVYYNQVYTPTEPYVLFNIGIAYRIRQDLEKKEEIK